MSAGDNVRLVYSSDGSHKNRCKKCGEIQCQCQQPVEIQPEKVLLKIRVEKKGRGGKAVSVIYNFPYNPKYFTQLAKKLKGHCGTGGTYKDGQIEIQGDQREKIKAYLEKMDFQVKLAGG